MELRWKADEPLILPKIAFAKVFVPRCKEWRSHVPAKPRQRSEHNSVMEWVLTYSRAGA